MSCEKHGYTNNTICQACDAELVDKYTTSPAIKLARECGLPSADIEALQEHQPEFLKTFYAKAQAAALRDAADEVAGGWPADHLRHMAEERERGT